MAVEPCPHCPDGHENPARRPWSVWVDPNPGGEKPTVLHVAKSGSQHVSESDAEWLRELIRRHR